jgi:hypothetical protein
MNLIDKGLALVSFTGTKDADLFREIAAWLDEDPNRVVIGLWSTGFGEPWEIDLQLMVDVSRPES